MLNVFRSMYVPSVLSVCLLAAAVIFVGGCDQNQDTEQLPVYKVDGPVKVSYEYATSEGSSVGVQTPVEVSEILMFEQYVIIKKKDGSALLIPISKIRNLNWVN